MFGKFEKGIAPENLHSEVERLRKAAESEARDLLLDKVDSSLEGHERWLAVVSLMNKLNDEDPQRYRYVIEDLARRITAEKTIEASRAIKEKYGTQYMDAVNRLQ